MAIQSPREDCIYGRPDRRAPHRYPPDKGAILRHARVPKPNAKHEENSEHHPFGANPANHIFHMSTPFYRDDPPYIPKAPADLAYDLSVQQISRHGSRNWAYARIFQRSGGIASGKGRYKRALGRASQARCLFLSFKIPPARTRSPAGGAVGRGVLPGAAEHRLRPIHPGDRVDGQGEIDGKKARAGARVQNLRHPLRRGHGEALPPPDPTFPVDHLPAVLPGTAV